MKSKELINFAALNKVFNLERGTIRSGRIPTNHKYKVNELLNMVQYWIDKHKKP
jgi:hypothetical protein